MNANNNNSSETGEPRYPCKLCPKTVSANDDATLCDFCQT